MAKSGNSLITRASIQPLSGYILVEPIPAETRTASGIILPETAQERPAIGTVIAIGDDMVLENGKVIKSPVKVGDKVFYKKWGGDEIKVAGEDLKLVGFADIMALVK
ncbi:hypothetical protein A3A14_01350 [Candidatus Daviesbacteria bacterium RIFCSPLOWO2_01_FULL_43_38]|uniref:Co-chaperonin GroES n=3 Tax=Candidatus Daviesiibacteriota TaxID=1752718 RepID=A0A1F5K7F0_9BACT|nr:MAG: chaperonin GroS [Candidatus Daviesbacteria bacterium GW2011_GWA1_42_6]KKS70272.1 MAG: chaperonin GroS [Candidatus Daviesbacteria bacterium GW2011_GWA2_42_7]OGE18978.1 MAG: hypothetical protein A2874_02365 [Candidatus Daviesbacteria bacterium RIFCSPHIGHO2_01_FULL_43_17]OGE36877.1 MAG: hypothetical protein A3E45_03475 [Candidatus Daviesbacteria bacterium RIFCSPHIGHO2_12_FULL_43_11]OGE63303.1 MAG: hypothetical protein A3A14_01350 [Candidatus Daviesbacteria bacterium RIFCSPLOWO2_01_FULL_43_